MRISLAIFSLLFLALAASALTFSYLGAPRSAPHEARSSDGLGRVMIETSSGAHAFRVERAETPAEQARGLSGRLSLPEGEGMLFLYNAPASRGFWMKDMNFPIDIIWISKGRVIGASENAEPEPGVPLWGLTLYYPPEPADMVLEINAGLVERYGIEAGDEVMVRYYMTWRVLLLMVLGESEDYSSALRSPCRT